MELTVARLKVLGETDIADLDKKIANYKLCNDPTILNKDLETIQRETKQAQSKYNQLVSEISGIKQRHAMAIQQREKYNTDYANIVSEQNKIVAEIDELFIQQQDNQIQIISKNNEVSAKKVEVAKCLYQLKNEKAKLANVIEVHKTQDVEYQENLKVIRESIKKVEDEIKEHRQRAYQRYLDYEIAVKEISLEAIKARNPVNASFTELVPDLLQVFARNMGNFVKIREFYKELVSNTKIVVGIHFQNANEIIKNRSWAIHGVNKPYDSVKEASHGFIGLLHQNVCDLIRDKDSFYKYIGQQFQAPQPPPLHSLYYMGTIHGAQKAIYEKQNEEFLNIHYPNALSNYNIYMDKLKNNVHKFYNYCVCPECGYTDFILTISNPNNPNNTHDRQYILDIDRFNKWLDQNYKKLCQSVITDAKLNTVIQNTTYLELFDMLGSVFDIKGYNTYEFLLFIAFLGTGGKAHNLYEEF
jgi:hypothetical protein